MILLHNKEIINDSTGKQRLFLADKMLSANNNEP